MNIELTKKEYRRLLDMVYIGNWILNSARGEDRIRDYDDLESKLFAKSFTEGMPELCEYRFGEFIPSQAFADGGIHDAISSYEDAVFYEILAEELAMRDMSIEAVTEVTQENLDELSGRIDEYIEEFEENGVENIVLDK